MGAIWEIRMEVDFFCIKNHWCPVKNQGFFASLRMTAPFVGYILEGVVWRRSRQTTPSRNKIIVIQSVTS